MATTERYSVPATVEISTDNSRPIAGPGPHQIVETSSTVQLSGADSSDADGNSLTYQWAILYQPSGANAVLSSSTAIDPTFVAALTNAARDLRRQETARLLLDDICSKIEAAHFVSLPSSVLGKACHYALALWKKLTRFLEYPELELSTNLAENSMRPVALGRKNWLHIGSPQAGPKVAAILSVVESCRRLGLPVREYLASILPGLGDLSIQRIPRLTPAVWRPSQTQ